VKHASKSDLAIIPIFINDIEREFEEKTGLSNTLSKTYLL